MAGSVPRIWGAGDELRFVKSFTLGVDDHLATRYARTEALPFRRFALFMVFLALFFGLIYAHDLWLAGDRLWAVGVFLGAGVAGFGLAYLTYGFFRALFRGFWEGFLTEREAVDIPMDVEVDRNGVSVLFRQQTWVCPWESLRSVEEDNERYYFWISKWQAHILPKRLFEDDERAQFDAALRGWIGKSPHVLRRPAS